MTSGRARPVVLSKKTTREIVGRYPSARNAASAVGVDYVAIYRECKKRRLGRGELYWRYEDDFDPNEDFGRIGCYRPVIAINSKTRHWLWFESITAASMHFYGYEDGAGKAMRNGKECNGYMFFHADKRMRSEKCEVKA